MSEDKAMMKMCTRAGLNSMKNLNGVIERAKERNKFQVILNLVHFYMDLGRIDTCGETVSGDLVSFLDREEWEKLIERAEIIKGRIPE